MLGLRMGIDLGSASLHICVAGKGVVVSEPSVMVCDADTGKPVAMGNAAVEMLGRLPNSLKAVHPVRDGVMDHLEAAQQMLRPYITRQCGNRMFKPNVLMSVSTAVSRNEKRALLSVLSDCGCGRACFIDKPLAAAIGAGENCFKPSGVLCVEIGSGSVDAALISMGKVVQSACVRIGGRNMTTSIRRYLTHTRGYSVGFLTAEEIKKEVAGAVLRNTEVAFLVNGKRIADGIPELFEVTSTEMYWVLRNDLEAVAKTVESVLEKAPTELLSDVLLNGIVLTGGGANLYGIGPWLQERLSVPVRVAQEPEKAVVRGLDFVLRDVSRLFREEYVYLNAQTQED
ncbi:MAG: rod shape-determining protein [Clostridia bacterium]|nr:rod shape-determining protein [Clostridia bacterium]MBR6781290.1 rod shape-determining protein [Clostridia bacterium]